MPPLAFCNELIAAGRPRLGDQARAARALGASALELAPLTLSGTPESIRPSRAAALRAEIEGEGCRVSGLHWLLSGREGASVTDPTSQARAGDILRGLIDLCAALGGAVLVHGSPNERRPADGDSPAEAAARLPDFFRPLAEHAAAAGVTYCIEPLAESPVIHTVAEGLALVDAVGHSAFRTMIDTSAAGRAEPPVAGLVAAHLPDPRVAHLHLNETGRGAPGTGDDPWDQIVPAIARAGWSGPLTVEPFVLLDGSADATFARAAETLRAHWPDRGDQ